MLASCLAGETRPSLRAASADALPVAAGEPEAGAQEQGQEIGCTCTAAGACQCHRSEASGAHAKEDEALEQALLKETREILARFQEAEGEDGPAARWFDGPALNGTLELVAGPRRGGVACGGRGGCGCIGRLGCGCAARRGCAAWR